jgi:hypothetical protein
VSDARRFDLEVDALREEVRRMIADDAYKAAQARQENVNVITRLGVEINELRSDWVRTREQWSGMDARITRIEDIVAADAEQRPVRIELQDSRWRRIELWLIFGAVLLAAGEKGKRFALPHARIMIHQPLTGGVGGQATDIHIEANEIIQNRQELAEILARHSGQTVARILKDFDRNYYLSAEEAKAYGLVDAVIQRPPK